MSKIQQAKDIIDNYVDLDCKEKFVQDMRSHSDAFGSVCELRLSLFKQNPGRSTGDMSEAVRIDFSDDEVEKVLFSVEKVLEDKRKRLLEEMKSFGLNIEEE